ncbi:SubName: Full=Uncharacterized protein {ECO:0000313/EMBL:CCA72025.1} [Serendipita indica DSM 11827]|nr:SubName: Full=Uncharacterized protein {ECO:0000313/EMBL:CCA72025.1} [Serendipita indica DSM 11827]
MKPSSQSFQPPKCVIDTVLRLLVSLIVGIVLERPTRAHLDKIYDYFLGDAFREDYDECHRLTASLLTDLDRTGFDVIQLSRRLASHKSEALCQLVTQCGFDWKPERSLFFIPRTEETLEMDVFDLEFDDASISLPAPTRTNFFDGRHAFLHRQRRAKPRERVRSTDYFPRTPAVSFSHLAWNQASLLMANDPSSHVLLLGSLYMRSIIGILAAKVGAVEHCSTNEILRVVQIASQRRMAAALGRKFAAIMTAGRPPRTESELVRLTHAVYGLLIQLGDDNAHVWAIDHWIDAVVFSFADLDASTADLSRLSDEEDEEAVSDHGSSHASSS